MRSAARLLIRFTRNALQIFFRVPVLGLTYVHLQVLPIAVLMRLKRQIVNFRIILAWVRPVSLQGAPARHVLLLMATPATGCYQLSGDELDPDEIEQNDLWRLHLSSLPEVRPALVSARNSGNPACLENSAQPNASRTLRNLVQPEMLTSAVLCTSDAPPMSGSGQLSQGVPPPDTCSF